MPNEPAAEPGTHLKFKKNVKCQIKSEEMCKIFERENSSVQTHIHFIHTVHVQFGAFSLSPLMVM